MHKRYELAKELAKKAGGLLFDMRNEEMDTKTKSSSCDLVTNADFCSQNLVTSTIEMNFPEDSMLSEESFVKNGSSGWTWIIDPLDGTTNYAHGMPIYCVSIAAYKDGHPMIGAVYDPNRRELFDAMHENGVFLNGKRVGCSKRESLNVSMLATGFPYDKSKDLKNNNIKHFTAFLINTHAVRRLGSAALDLCYVGAGKLDGFWELKLRPWDIAAGALMVKEGGGRVTGFKGEPMDIYNPYIVASNGLIHGQMLKTLEESL